MNSIGRKKRLWGKEVPPENFKIKKKRIKLQRESKRNHVAKGWGERLEGL